MTPIIVPVGRQLGCPAPSPEVNLVGLDGAAEELDVHEATVWKAAFANPAHHAKLSVTRSFLADDISAKAPTITNPASVIGELLERGLLLEFDPVDGKLEDILNLYTLYPNADGLGSTPANPDTYRIGRDNNPFVEVNAIVYFIWAFSYIGDSLWGACQSYLDQLIEANPERAATDAAPPALNVAREISVNIPLLVSTTCAVLDKSNG